MSAKIGLWEHFRKLASFKGREDRASFWPYAALVFGIVTVVGTLMLLTMTAQSMRTAEDFPVQHPDPMNFALDFNDFSMPAQAHSADPTLSSGFLAAYLGLTLGLAVVLSAAAVVRRLHDRGRSGAWALMPLPFLLYTSIQMTRILDPMMRGEPSDMLFLAAALSNMLFWVALGALVVLLAGAGDPERNRYDSDS